MAEVHLAVLDLEIILVRRYVLVHADLRLRGTLMLDLHFQVEWRNAF